MGEWQENNSRYLSAAMFWLRSRLQELAQELAGDESVDPEAIRQGEAAMAEAEANHPRPALKYLSECFNLSLFEERILLLCVAMELDPEIPKLCAQAQQNPNCAYPTFSLAFSCFDGLHWDAISSESPLRYWRLIKIVSSGSVPLIHSPLKVDERIINYLMGSNQLDGQLAAMLFPVTSAKKQSYLPGIATSQKTIAGEICQLLKSADPAFPIPVVQLLGSDARSKQQIAQEVAHTFGRRLQGLQGELIPSNNTEFIEFVRLWEREEHLLPLALYIDTQEIASATNGTVSLRRFLSNTRGLIFLDSRELGLPVNREIVTREVGKPNPMEQREAWVEMLGEQAGTNPELLTSQFNLNLEEIEHIATTVLGNDTLRAQKMRCSVPAATGTQQSIDPSTVAVDQQLWTACLHSTRPRLESLAQRLDTKATWENLVLPKQEMGVLRQIVHQVRLRSRVYDDWGFRERMNRGLGVSAMFAGDSGTGKTMAAEVIAKDLNLHLYRIDLSSVVSKYIGETEKNLRRLFDAAEEGGAILFFDEADALFGKRSEVTNSHDRYANIEINYLLQRIESYRGLAILATNLKSSLDSAFLRRLRFIIDFPFPSREYRQQLWQKVFPPETPLGTIDYRYLGKLNLTGGTIHNIAINAAFVAAEQGKAVGMEQILAAVKTEYQKLERPIYESEFQWNESKAHNA